MLKNILVFQSGNLIKQITYKTKAEAKKQYSVFLKRGILDPNTGEIINNAAFELL